MGNDMKGQLTFCLAFYATNPSFLPMFVPPSFTLSTQKLVLTRPEIYFVLWGGMARNQCTENWKEKYTSTSVSRAKFECKKILFREANSKSVLQNYLSI